MIQHLLGFRKGHQCSLFLQVTQQEIFKKFFSLVLTKKKMFLSRISLIPIFNASTICTDCIIMAASYLFYPKYSSCQQKWFLTAENLFQLLSSPHWLLPLVQTELPQSHPQRGLVNLMESPLLGENTKVILLGNFVFIGTWRVKHQVASESQLKGDS